MGFEGKFKLSYPVRDPVVVQAFGVNRTGVPDFYTKYGLPAHEGIDFHASSGTPIYACADGRVSRIERKIFQGSGDAYGIQIRIEHLESDGVYETIYAHLESVDTSLIVGSRILRGQLIGISDNTGHSTAPHLHLTLKKRGNTAAGIKQQLGNGMWVLYPSDIVNPTPYFSSII